MYAARGRQVPAGAPFRLAPAPVLVVGLVEPGLAGRRTEPALLVAGRVGVGLRGTT